MKFCETEYRNELDFSSLVQNSEQKGLLNHKNLEAKSISCTIMQKKITVEKRHFRESMHDFKRG